MKKKILVLVLVLGLASAAHAGFSISVGGEAHPAESEITLNQSDTIILDIHGDGATPSPSNVWMFVEGLGSINGGNMIYAGSLSAYLDLDEAAGVVGVTPQELLDQFGAILGTTLVDLSYSIYADPASPPLPLEGRLTDGIEFHCEGYPGDVLVTIAGDDFGIYDQLVIHQVPEPITFALLGLGGLFLRRRK